MARHVVLTGGEPILAAGLADLARLLRTAGYHITIETAGTVSPGEIVYDLASLSPKLSGSVPPADAFGAGWVAKHEKIRLQPGVIREWIARADYQLKFVVGSRAELEEVDRLVANLGTQVAPHKILLMPEGVDSELLKEKGRVVAEWCKETGYRFCDRLHVHLYGHTRGT
jgi:7-carboxy-7-deazaguanine synthase